MRLTVDTGIEIFRQETAGDRIEEMTRRPIVNGRAAREARKQDWTFLADGRPIGWVSLFDFNLRNRSAEFGYGIVKPMRGKGLGGGG